MDAKKVLEDLKRRFPNEPEYHQAVEEVLGTIEEEYNKHPEFDKVNLVERLCIPDREVSDSDQHGLPHPAQQRHWPLQGWYPFPQLCEPRYPEVPRIRADFQELTHYTPNGWW